MKSLSSLIIRDRLNIPLHLDDDAAKSYLKQIAAFFEEIYYSLDKISEAEYFPRVKKLYLKKIQRIQDILLKSLELHLAGHPAEAFRTFSGALKKTGFDYELKSLRQIRIPAMTPFFRVKPVWEDIPVGFGGKEGFLNQRQPLNIFHPPFNLRRSVGTNRFSIPGYPALYLSENLQTSYSECFQTKKSENAFHSICFKNTRPLYLIDVSNPVDVVRGDYFDPISAPGDDMTGIIMIEQMAMHQLVIACHAKVNYQPAYPNENYVFKTEYIIPQLLLQWLKMNKYPIDGILYHSCTGDAKFGKSCSHRNLILPVFANRENGFCENLQRLFLSTDVYSHYKPLDTKDPLASLNAIQNKLVKARFKPLTDYPDPV